MTLKLHDNETGNTFVARVSGIDYLYQAEQWVIDTFREKTTVVKWILSEGLEELCVWERPPGSLEFPTITKRVSHQ